VERATALLDAREAEASQAATEAHEKAAARRAEILAAGGNPDDSLIEAIRPRLGSLDTILTSYGYDRRGSGPATKYRHPNSQSGSFGADVKTFGGVERCYSHNGGDPLHAGNLPSWCNVTAIDVVDVVTILDYGGDRAKALHELAKRFGLNKGGESKAVARLIHQLIRSRASIDTIQACAFAEGQRLGLSRSDVDRIAASIAAKGSQAREAA
jgi:hypothetical protein